MKSKQDTPEPVKQSGYDTFHLNEMNYKTLLLPKFINRKPYQPHDPRKIAAFIPGKIKKVHVKKGKKVKEGDILLVLEAMKMNNNILAPMKGTIKEVYVTQGISVPKNALLVEFE